MTYFELSTSSLAIGLQGVKDSDIELVIRDTEEIVRKQLIAKFIGPNAHYGSFGRSQKRRIRQQAN